MTLKPCIECGVPSEQTRCDEHRRQVVRARNGTRERRTDSARWIRFSRRLRKMSPFCEFCGSEDQLTVDHVIPFSERPDLEYVVEACRILCRSCNSTRGDRVTDEERAEVEARLARKTRGVTPLPGSSHTGGKAQRALHTPGGYL